MLSRAPKARGLESPGEKDLLQANRWSWIPSLQQQSERGGGSLPARCLRGNNPAAPHRAGVSRANNRAGSAFTASFVRSALDNQLRPEGSRVWVGLGLPVDVSPGKALLHTAVGYRPRPRTGSRGDLQALASGSHRGGQCAASRQPPTGTAKQHDLAHSRPPARHQQGATGPRSKSSPSGKIVQFSIFSWAGSTKR